MADKFRDRYRVHTARANWWDYGKDGIYFITICTQNREHYFGEIKDGAMNLSEIGQIAQKCWNEIPNHFPFTHLEAFVVMPNHVHGILVIDKTTHKNSNRIETQHLVSQKLKETQPNKFGPQSNNLASVIRGYKVGVTKNARQIHADFSWQSSYHEHIIKDLKSYDTILDYIENNPQNWEKDKFYKSNESI